ncbi:hypothetical protein IHQ68_01430 [Chelatococcus sambhunathii]|uniref:Uncharacterized protein n=1 Tax=Chelatococcus sambhunathii TaxID=363953 RepID=A0ABU1DBJ1_9HYPH|nr:hypothetical protein [Chelatococcus sambhunathii]MDR4305285.1 hypothetical protein [Chelatococcus sambhunathii]
MLHAARRPLFGPDGGLPVSDAIEARLDEMAQKIAALEEEVATLGKRIRKLRKRVITAEKGDGAKADASDDD